MSTPDTSTPGPKERRLHERVYLRDVAALLPADTLVDVVGRAELVPEGPRRYDHVEHLIVLPEDAYEILKSVGVMPRARGGGATPRPSGVTPLDLARLEAEWGERAERYERVAADAQELRLDGATPRRLGELCRQVQGAIEGLRIRAEAAGAAPVAQAA